ncbi:MAG: chemotaxis protein CheY [Alphaproteobacteria bacterium]|jgi:two-component system phosphate regulon response regulator OmpR|nr:chemotaxis protein CheY [Alphaproteobacteria bacterium]
MTTSQTQPRLLVVDDDRRLRELLVKFLSDNGFLVSSAANAAEARAYLASQPVDLVVLDVMMPGEDGLSLTSSLSEKGQGQKGNGGRMVPVLLLTARDQVDDRIHGLEAGADDYLTKPFDPRELLARIKAILRRASAIEDEAPPELVFGSYRFNQETGLLVKDEEVIFLSSTELVLLKILAQNPHKPFSREELAQRIGHRVSERTIDVQITRLRRKIGDDPRQPRYLQTVRHIGYVLSPE